GRAGGPTRADRNRGAHAAGAVRDAARGGVRIDELLGLQAWSILISLRAAPLSGVSAVAVLVLLARAARAILVAADLAPGRGIFGIAVGGGRGHQRGVGEGHLVFAGVGIELVRFH